MVDSISQKTETTPNKTYSGGKIGGGVVGAGVAGLLWNKQIKENKICDEFINSDELKTAVDEQSIDKIRTAITNSKMGKTSKKLYDFMFNANKEAGTLADYYKQCKESLGKFKKLRATMNIFLAATTVLLGVGIGSIIDKNRKND